MEFVSNPILPVVAGDTADTEGELQYNDTSNKIGWYNGSAIRTSMSEELLASTSNGEGASLVGIEDSAGHFTATEVEAALAENAARIDIAEAAVA